MISQSTWQEDATRLGREAHIEALLTEHRGAIVKLASTYGAVWNVPIDDLIQEGSIAMMRSYDKYDPSIGRFLPFVWRRVKGAITRYCADNAHMLSSGDGAAVRVTRELVALGDSSDSIPDSSDVSETVETSMDAELAKSHFKSLSRREKSVIRRHYLLGESLTEIGSAYGLTREAVRLWEISGLKKLRKLMAA